MTLGRLPGAMLLRRTDMCRTEEGILCLRTVMYKMGAVMLHLRLVMGLEQIVMERPRPVMRQMGLVMGLEQTVMERLRIVMFQEPAAMECLRLVMGLEQTVMERLRIVMFQEPAVMERLRLVMGLEQTVMESLRTVISQAGAVMERRRMIMHRAWEVMLPLKMVMLQERGTIPHLRITICRAPEIIRCPPTAMCRESEDMAGRGIIMGPSREATPVRTKDIFRMMKIMEIRRPEDTATRKRGMSSRIICIWRKTAPMARPKTFLTCRRITNMILTRTALIYRKIQGMNRKASICPTRPLSIKHQEAGICLQQCRE